MGGLRDRPRNFDTALAVSTTTLLGIDASAFTALLGRSKDLTGRTELWHSVGSMIQARPFLGYGFSGFWSGGSLESYLVERYVGWSPTYSHNGYLELLLNLGLVGCLLFLAFLSRGLSQAVRLAEHRTAKEDIWPLAFLVFVVVHNCAECSILSQNCFEWALFVATVISANPVVYALMSENPATAALSAQGSFEQELSPVGQGYAKRT